MRSERRKRRSFVVSSYSRLPGSRRAGVVTRVTAAPLVRLMNPTTASIDTRRSKPASRALARHASMRALSATAAPMASASSFASWFTTSSMPFSSPLATACLHQRRFCAVANLSTRRRPVKCLEPSTGARTQRLLPALRAGRRGNPPRQAAGGRQDLLPARRAGSGLQSRAHGDDHRTASLPRFRGCLPHRSRCRHWSPRELPFYARRPADDVPWPPVDDAAIRGVWHGRRIERAVSLPARAGGEGAERRLRSADTDRLRLGSSACRRRSGPRRRGHRLDRRHDRALRRHSARVGVHVDDDQLDGHHPARTLRGRRQAARRRTQGSYRYRPERHPEGVRGPRHLHLSSRTVAPDRHRHHLVLRTRGAAVELDLDQRLPHS